MTLDCRLDHVDFQGAMLNGSSYGRVAARDIRNLHSAAITQGGATQEEVARLQVSIFRELGIPLFPTKQRSIEEQQRRNHPGKIDR